MTRFSISAMATYGLVACALAVLIGAYLLLAPGPVRLAPARRRPVAPRAVGPWTHGTGRASTLIETLLRRIRPGVDLAVLERSGVTMPLPDFILRIGAAALVAAAAGLVLAGPTVGLLLAVAVPLVAKIGLNLLADRRRTAFADQLEDTLQLMASSLRAGHSLLHALASVAREAETPTSVEFVRVLNETRVGRPLSHALEETAVRMRSADFTWVAEAIAINRETGGNLAEILDGVASTIRERNQIRRQVKALSAEGTLSAYVLMALPFGIAGFLLVANPTYLAKFTQSLLGYGLLGAGAVLLIVGGLWLRTVVRVKF